MHGGPAATELGDDLAVPELDDAHAPSVENRRMRAVVQRVSRAAVRVDGEVVGACGPGLLVLVGAGHEDTAETAERLAGKIARLRIFRDDDGRFDRSLLDTGGEALVVSQFTLLADSNEGELDRASRTPRTRGRRAAIETFCDALRGLGVPVQTGVFGAHMEVELVNDGPVTLILELSRSAGQSSIGPAPVRDGLVGVGAARFFANLAEVRADRQAAGDTTSRRRDLRSDRETAPLRVHRTDDDSVGRPRGRGSSYPGATSRSGVRQAA